MGSESAYYSKDQSFWEKGDSKALADALILLGFTGKQLDMEKLAQITEQSLKLRN